MSLAIEVAVIVVVAVIEITIVMLVLGGLLMAAGSSSVTRSAFLTWAPGAPRMTDPPRGVRRFQFSALGTDESGRLLNTGLP
jgi:hypothetical protein